MVPMISPALVADGESVAQDGGVGGEAGKGSASRAIRAAMSDELESLLSSCSIVPDRYLGAKARTALRRFTRPLKRRSSTILRALTCSPSFDYIRHGGGYAALVIAQGYGPAPGAQFLAGIPHDNRMSGKLKHFDVVVVVTDGHDLFAPEAAMGGPALQGVALGTAGIQHVDHGQIALRIFGAQDGDAVVHAAGFERAQGFGSCGPWSRRTWPAPDR